MVQTLTLAAMQSSYLKPKPFTIITKQHSRPKAAHQKHLAAQRASTYFIGFYEI
jgi:hypothetical protein